VRAFNWDNPSSVETRFANGVVEHRNDDALNQLKEVRAVRTSDRQELTRFTYTLNAAGRRELINGVEQGTYRYDRNSNLVEMTEGGVTPSHVWDDRNRLVQVLADGVELAS